MLLGKQLLRKGGGDRTALRAARPVRFIVEPGKEQQVGRSFAGQNKEEEGLQTVSQGFSHAG
jgi:hypothetical protein